MAAAGAWKIPPGYRQGMSVPLDQRPRVRLATKAIQRRLIDLECLVADPDRLDGGWGPKTAAAVTAFQNASLLVADGWVGPKTAKALWQPLYVWWQAQLGIPGNLLYGQGFLESAMDPGAEGGNPNGVGWYDRGLHQLNKHAYPQISDAQAYDAAWAIAWSADKLRTAFDSLGEWRFAAAAHNSPSGAAAWSRGEVPRTPDEQAARDKLVRYVELVFKAAGSTAGP